MLHGVRTYLLQSPTGQIIETHSISAGLDYPGVGPEHAWLKDSGRAEYVVATDEEALRGFKLCTELEGIIPALESAHAVWGAVEVARSLPKEADVVMVSINVHFVMNLFLAKGAFSVSRAGGIKMLSRFLSCYLGNGHRPLIGTSRHRSLFNR